MAFIASKLEEWGVEHETGVAETGIVALVKGRNPEKRTIALRSDHDALPITEENEVPYCSQNEGVMHACGHDVHTSSHLGAVKILHQLRDEWEGTIKCIFQPGEETAPGGASLMIKAGALEKPRPTEILGQHVYSDLPAGKVGFRPGKYMASADELYLTVKGRGGHAALPFKLIDPILIASHIVVAMQQVVSRNARPDIPSVVSWGKFIGNGSSNIIPDKVTLSGTFRTFDEEWRRQAWEHMRRIAEGTAASMGATAEFEIRQGYPFLVNDEVVTARAKKLAVEYLGQDNVIDLELRMTAEDFSYYSQQMPGCFYRLGVANEERGITHGLHTSRFDIDEEALKTGMGLFAWLALEEVGR